METERNICHFIPFRKDAHDLHTIHFVLETQPQIYTRLRSESIYKVHYVCGGQGCLHIPGKVTPLQKGDLFFTFPAFPYAIESADSAEKLRYLYISFVGFRGNMILESLQINSSRFLFHHAEDIQEFWEKGVATSGHALDWISESVLLYTFAYLSGELFPERSQSRACHSIDKMKKYIDEHFTDQKFSLAKMSCALSYNPKYISSTFKKHIGIGVIDYLNTIRIQNACTLIEQGFTSMSDIADLCGYSNVQYFSKIFKARMGIAPTQYSKSLTQQ